jgi:hypothetical protein
MMDPSRTTAEPFSASLLVSFSGKSLSGRSFHRLKTWLSNCDMTTCSTAPQLRPVGRLTLIHPERDRYDRTLPCAQPAIQDIHHWRTYRQPLCCHAIAHGCRLAFGQSVALDDLAHPRGGSGGRRKERQPGDEEANEAESDVEDDDEEDDEDDGAGRDGREGVVVELRGKDRPSVSEAEAGLTRPG